MIRIRSALSALLSIWIENQVAQRTLLSTRVIQTKAKIIMLVIVAQPRMKHLKLVRAGLRDSRFEQICTALLLRVNQLALIQLLQDSTQKS